MVGRSQPHQFFGVAVALAQALDLSPSYLNQIEQNQRPLTVSVLLKLNRTLGEIGRAHV